MKWHVKNSNETHNCKSRSSWGEWEAVNQWSWEVYLKKRLAKLSFVFWMSWNRTQFAEGMCKLTLVAKIEISRAREEV